MKKTITTTPEHTTVEITFESDEDFKAFDAYSKSLWREAVREQRRQRQTSEKKT